MTAAEKSAGTTAGTTLVMYGEGMREAARRMLPNLPEETFVPAGRERLREAARHGIAQAVLVAGMAGLTELLGGRAGLLESITLDMDCGVALAGDVARAATAQDVYALWEAAGSLGPCGRELCRRTAGELERVATEAAGSPVASQVVLMDASGERMVGMYGRMARR